MWCKGKMKLREPDALRWAAQTEMLGRGGYICGDHDWSDRCEMVDEAKAVRDQFAPSTPEESAGE